MGLIEAARFCCFIIEFVVLHCNNVLQVFPIHSMHVCGVISDWHLIPVHDWLVCSPFSPVLLAVHPFCFISALILVEVRSLHALMPCFSVVYCCAFLAVSIALRKGYVFWPWSSKLLLEGSLTVCSVIIDLCWILCACLHELLGWPGFYWSFAGFLSTRSRYCN